MGLRATSPVLVGRQGEMARLEQALDVARRRRVSGGADRGRGGSRQDAPGARADDACRGARVPCLRRAVHGSRRGDLAAGPAARDRRSLVDDLDSEALDLVVGGARGVLAELVPELGGERAGDAPVSSDRLCELVVGMFKRLAQRAPLVVVVEDLHWADAHDSDAVLGAGPRGPRASAAAGRYVPIRRAAPPPSAAAGAGRDRTGRQCERIDVRPFDRVATAELIGALGGAVVGPVVCGRCPSSQRRQSVLRRGVDRRPHVRSGRAARHAARRRSSLAPPCSMTRPSTCSASSRPPARRLPTSLPTSAGSSAEALRTTLDRLFATALLVPDGDEVRFRHELGREVFYDELVPGERARSTPGSPASVEFGDRNGWARSPATGRPPTTHPGRWRRRSPPAARRCGREQQPRPKATSAERSNCGTPSRTPRRWPGSIIPPCSSRPPSPPSMPATSTGRSSSLSRLWRSWPTSTRCARPRCGCSCVTSTGSSSRWDDCASPSPGPSPSSRRHHRRAPGRRHSRTPRSASLYANRAAEAKAYAREAVAVAEAVGDPDMVVNAYDTSGNGVGAAGDTRRTRVALANLARCGPGVSPERTHHRVQRVNRRLDRSRPIAEIPALAEPPWSWPARSGLGGPRAVGRRTLGRVPRRAREMARGRSSSSASSPISSTTRQTRANSPVLGRRPDPPRPPRRGPPADRTGACRVGRGQVVRESRLACGSHRHLRRRRRPPRRCRGARRRGARRDQPSLDGTRTSSPPGSPHWPTAPRRTDRTPRRRERASPCHRDAVDRVDGRRRAEDGALTDGATALPRSRHGRARTSPAAGPTRSRGRSWPPAGSDSASATKRPSPVSATPKRCWPARRARRRGTASRGRRARLRLRRRSGTRRQPAARRHRRPRPSRPPAARHRRITRSAARRRPSDSTRSHAARTRGARLARGGRSNGEIAKALFISTKTASVHVSNILRKLGVTNRVEAAGFARRS